MNPSVVYDSFYPPPHLPFAFNIIILLWLQLVRTKAFLSFELNSMKANDKNKLNELST